jgi:hypothetical protein
VTTGYRLKIFDVIERWNVFCKVWVPTGDQVVVVPDLASGPMPVLASGPMPVLAVLPVASRAGAVCMCI